MGTVSGGRVSARSLRNEIARNLLRVRVLAWDETVSFTELRDRLEDAEAAIEAVLSFGLAFGWDEVIDEVCAIPGTSRGGCVCDDCAARVPSETGDSDAG